MKLFVNGGILAERLLIEKGWADYVFDDNYALMPLEKVNTFIEENGHLPNTPSSEDLNGYIPVGDMTQLQQEKIEELFLHMIDMNEELKSLKQENESLRTRINELEQK